MTKKAIEIYRFKENEKDFFEIFFKGIPKHSNIDNQKTEKLISSFMDRCHGEMLDDVRFLRTILRDYKETKLHILYKDNEKEEVINYNNLKITCYEKHENNDFKIKYTPKNRISYTFNNKSINNIHDIINQSQEDIDELENATKIELSKEAKLLIEVYRLFFNENPDFTSKNINLKFQTMITILEGFNITINDYGVSYVNTKNLPLSFKLLKTTHELFPFGEITDSDETIKIDEFYKKRIILIGQELKNNIDLNIENLITLSIIIHAARYNISHVINTDNISQYIDQSNEDIEKNVQLIKKISDKLLKN